jgi:hypothetical protein
MVPEVPEQLRALLRIALDRSSKEKRVPTPIGSASGRHSRTPGSISGAVSGDITAAKTASGGLGITVVLSTTFVRWTIGRNPSTVSRGSRRGAR